jgi:hypothetical protein
VYFTTPHFEGDPPVRVKLDAIVVVDLTELIVDAWLTQPPKNWPSRSLRRPGRGSSTGSLTVASIDRPGASRGGTMPELDSTFYRSPSAAVAAPPEQLAYVVAFDPTGQAKDALAVVDCEPNSSTYGGVVGWSELPTAGNELHHFGWSACSSALCHEGHVGHLERRYLLVPGIRSSTTYVLDTGCNPLHGPLSDTTAHTN